MGAGGDQVIAGVTFAAPLAPDIPEQEMRKDVAGSSAAMVISTNGPDSLRRMAVSSDNETLASLGCSTGERGCRAGLSFSGEPHKEQTAPFFGIRPQPVNRYWEIARRRIWTSMGRKFTRTTCNGPCPVEPSTSCTVAAPWAMERTGPGAIGPA